LLAVAPAMPRCRRQQPSFRATFSLPLFQEQYAARKLYGTPSRVGERYSNEYVQHFAVDCSPHPFLSSRAAYPPSRRHFVILPFIFFRQTAVYCSMFAPTFGGMRCFARRVPQRSVAPPPCRVTAKAHAPDAMLIRRFHAASSDVEARLRFPCFERHAPLQRSAQRGAPIFLPPPPGARR